jgi:tRNA(Ile)-lysidine synthase
MSPRAIGVACSGGRDSVALLHATAHAAQAQGLLVHALHVQHGLQAQAEEWLAFVQRLCARWARSGLPLRFAAHRVQSRPAANDSIEAWARRERYAALAMMAKAAGCEAVLLAQHAQDQAETFLLQALRGAGPAGLAGMPAAVQRDGLWWWRPWLQRTPLEIERYARQHRLRWVQDPSNADARFARSRLRTQVLPALLNAFPGAVQAFGDAAQRAADAAELLQERAAEDLQAVRLLRHEADALNWTEAMQLSAARRRLLLATWLAPHMPAGVPGSLLQRLLTQAAPGRSGQRWPAGEGELLLYRGLMRFVPQPSAPVSDVRQPGVEANDESPSQAPQRLNLSRAGTYPVPAWGGALEVSVCRHGGLPLSALREVELRPRSGGEQFVLSPGGQPRSLKRQFQARGLNALQRVGPLLYSAAGELLWVPGLGADARALRPQGRREVRWRPSA